MKINPVLPLFTVVTLLCLPAKAGPLTRAEAVRIAQEYANYRWTSTEKNALHGKDADGVDVQTPNIAPGGAPDPKLWSIAAENTGMPYKWGGFDSIESFAAGVKKGKAAGDMFTPLKRKLGGNAVSSNAVGIDCSGFISRCWKLKTKYSTESLPSICIQLSSVSELKAGDVMDSEGGHVVMFEKWLDDAKTSAQFYESSPYSKVIRSVYMPVALAWKGYKPLRYKLIRD